MPGYAWPKHRTGRPATSPDRVEGDLPQPPGVVGIEGATPEEAVLGAPGSRTSDWLESSRDRPRMPSSWGDVATRTLVAAPCSIVLNVSDARRAARASGSMWRE